MPCHHPSRMVQPPSGMKQQFAVCSSWSWRWCPGIRACFLSFFPLPSFFPSCTLEHGFCATFFQWYTADVQMDACIKNHTVIRKRRNQARPRNSKVLLVNRV
jgi:hypothetical protein